MDRRQICFVHWIVEAYGGLATVTTVDPAKGLVRILMAPGSAPYLEKIFQAFQSDGMIIESVERP